MSSAESTERRQLGQGIVRALDQAGEGRAAADPALQRLDGGEDQGVEGDREDRPRQDEALALGGQQAQGDSQARQDERELADLRQARRDGERRC